MGIRAVYVVNLLVAAVGTDPLRGPPHLAHLLNDDVVLVAQVNLHVGSAVFF